MAHLSKLELKKQIRRFIDDKDRGISMGCFAEICGVSESLLWKVFVEETRPLTEVVQIRVNRAYEEWKRGNLRTMRRRDGTVYADYRKEPVSPCVQHMGIVYAHGGFHVQIGPKNRHDYSAPTIDEALKG
jgi:hypothetical protein